MVYYSFIFFSLSSISLLSSFSLYFSINGNHIFIASTGVAGLPSNKIWRIIMIAMVTLMRIIKVFKVIKVIIVMIGMIKELLTYYVSRKRGKGELAQCMLAIAGRGLRTPHFGRRNLWRAPISDDNVMIMRWRRIVKGFPNLVALHHRTKANWALKGI